MKKLTQKQKRILDMMQTGYELSYSSVEGYFFISKGLYIESVRKATVDALIKAAQIAPLNFKHGIGISGKYKLCMEG